MPVAANRHTLDWRALVNEARAGDADALGQVCEQLRVDLLQACGHRLGGDLRPKLAASDVVQLSLLEAWSALDQFQGASKADFRAWVRSILEHNLADAVRKYCQTQKRAAAREVPLESADVTNEVASPQRTPSSLVRRKETDEELLRAVAQLPARRRRIVELRYREGLSHAEIGERLGLSEVAVRKDWSRAIDQLRSKLGA